MSKALQILDTIADEATRQLARVYGSSAKVKWRAFSPPEWLAGFYSPMGFHIRGRTEMGIGLATVTLSAAVAVKLAVHSRYDSDPDPQFPDAWTCWEKRRRARGELPATTKPPEAPCTRTV